MNSRERRAPSGFMAVIAGGVALVLGVASTAFGCASATSPYLNALEPNRGAVPASVVVSGGNWQPGVNITFVWAGSGEVIGTTTPSASRSFSVPVTIPASAESGKDYVGFVRATQGTTTGNTPFGVDSPDGTSNETTPAPAPQTYAETEDAPPTTRPAPASSSSPPPAPPSSSSGSQSTTTTASSTGDSDGRTTSASKATSGERTAQAPRVTTVTTTALKVAGTTAPTTTVPGAVAETSTNTAKEPATTTSEAPEKDTELAAQPAASKSWWGLPQVAALLLGGLLALAGMAFGRRGRTPKP